MIALVAKTNTAASTRPYIRRPIGTAPVRTRAIGRDSCAIGAILTRNIFFLLFVVAARLLGISGAEDPDGDSDDHGEPDKREGLQRQKAGKEDPFDGAVHANWAADVLEGIKQVSPAVGVCVGGSHLRSGTGVAAVRHPGRDVLVDGPAQLRVVDMARDEPCYHEHTKSDIAGGLVLQVFQDFGRLVFELAHVFIPRVRFLHTGNKRSTMSMSDSTTLDTL